MCWKSPKMNAKTSPKKNLKGNTPKTSGSPVVLEAMYSAWTQSCKVYNTYPTSWKSHHFKLSFVVTYHIASNIVFMWHIQLSQTFPHCARMFIAPKIPMAIIYHISLKFHCHGWLHHTKFFLCATHNYFQNFPCNIWHQFKLSFFMTYHISLKFLSMWQIYLSQNSFIVT